jgi:hemoglobin-like flavoprotein
MNINRYLRISLLTVSCITAIIPVTAQQAPMPTMGGDFNLPPMSEAEMKALEEFTKFFESLPEEDQKKILDEATQIAQQIDEEIKKMTPEERAKFEEELEREFQSLFGGEGAGLPLMPQEPAPSTTTTTEPKKIVNAPSKEDREKLKGSLEKLIKHIDTIIQKSDYLQSISNNHGIESRWNGQRESLNILKAYCTVITHQEKLLTILLGNEHTILQSNIEKLIKSLEKNDTELTVSNDKKNTAPQLTTQQALPLFKAIVSALEQLSEIDQVTWGVKNIVRTHAPEDFKKIDTQIDTQIESKNITQPIIKTDKEENIKTEKTSHNQELKNNFSQSSTSRQTRTLETALNQLATTLEVNNITDLITSYTHEIRSARGAQEALPIARKLQRVCETTKLVDIVNDIAVGLTTTQDKAIRSNAQKKLSSHAIIELREALNNATSLDILKRINGLPEKQQETRKTLSDIYELLKTIKQHLA